LAVAALLGSRNRAVPWPSLLWLGAFFALGLFAVRGVFWWAVAAPPIVAATLHDGRVPGPVRREQGDSRSLAHTALGGVVVALAILMIVLQWVGHVDRNSPPQRSVDSAPLSLTSVVRRVVRPGMRMFNAQRWGSWF